MKIVPVSLLTFKPLVPFVRKSFQGIKEPAPDKRLSFLNFWLFSKLIWLEELFSLRRFRKC